MSVDADKREVIKSFERVHAEDEFATILRRREDGGSALLVLDAIKKLNLTLPKYWKCLVICIS